MTKNGDEPTVSTLDLFNVLCPKEAIVHTSRTAALERNLTASAICSPQLQLFPVRNHRGSQTKLSAKPLGCLHRFVSRLPVGMQHMCAGEHKITSFKYGAIRSHIDSRTIESRGGGVLRQRLLHRVSPTPSPPRIYSRPTVPSNSGCGLADFL